jgi:pilus assembly protein FimV
VTENSFLTDFSRAGLGTIDTDEVDPIAEAEVYMAYGRDAQAEEILRDALLRDGSRHEVRLKLLEIYSARKNTAAFEGAAQELYAATQGNGPFWAQAAAMGKALDPQNPLYQQQEPVDTGSLDQTMVMSAGTLGDLTDTAQLRAPLVSDAPKVDDAAHADLGADLDFQLDSAPVEAPASAVPAEMDFDLGFDVPQAGEHAAAPVAEHHEAASDLDMGALEIPAAGHSAEALHEAAPSDLDFDLGDFSLDAKPAAAVEPAPQAAAADEILSLDIPLDMGGEHAAAHAEPEVAPHAEEHAASFELPPMDEGFDLDLGAVPEVTHEAPAVATSSAGMAELDSPDLAGGLDFDFDMGEGQKKAEVAAPEFDIGDVSLDLDVAPGPAGPGEVMDFGVEMDDPVTTKIDLARAYIDMGDKEGAREILQEAVSEGNADQKASAETLLAQL